jgi:hypothetical protein
MQVGYQSPSCQDGFFKLWTDVFFVKDVMRNQTWPVTGVHFALVGSILVALYKKCRRKLQRSPPSERNVWS